MARRRTPRGRGLGDRDRSSGWSTTPSEVVGRISLRHELNALAARGGRPHRVRRPALGPAAGPRHRARSALMLAGRRRRGIDPVLVTCDVDNVASRKVIEANGGVLEDVRGASCASGSDVPDRPASRASVERVRSTGQSTGTVEACERRDQRSGQASGSRPSWRPAGRRRPAAAPAAASRARATVRPSSRIATVSASRWAGSATRSCHSALSKATMPPGLSSRSASVEVVGVLRLVAVAEHQVVVAVGEPGEHVERGAGDQPDPLRGDAGLGERLLGQPLVLGLGVDGGEHAVGAHAAQQPDAGDAGAGADLDDRAGLGHRGQEAQRGAAAGADRDDADLLGAGAGRGQHLVLGDELLGVGPARRLQSRDDDGLPRRCPCRASVGIWAGLYRLGDGRAREQPARAGPLTGQTAQRRREAVPSGRSQERLLAWRQAAPRWRADGVTHPGRGAPHDPADEPTGRTDGLTRDDWQPPSWDEIVAQHSARVYRLAYRLTGNPHDAEDLTQEVFVRVFRSLSSYTPGHLRGLAAPDHHEPLPRPGPPQGQDPLRRARRRRRDPASRAGPSRPTSQVLDGLFDDDVEAALAALPPDFRAAVVLCDIEGLSYEEIADVLGLKLGTVRSRIHRGRTHAAQGARAPRPGRRAARATPVPPSPPPPAAGAAGDVMPAMWRLGRSPRLVGQRARRRPARRRADRARLGARHALPAVPPPGRARGLGQAAARRRSPARPAPERALRPVRSGSLLDLDPAGVDASDAWAETDRLEDRSRTRRRAGIALVGAGSVSAAVLGLSTLERHPDGHRRPDRRAGRPRSAARPRSTTPDPRRTSRPAASVHGGCAAGRSAPGTTASRTPAPVGDRR